MCIFITKTFEVILVVILTGPLFAGFRGSTTLSLVPVLRCAGLFVPVASPESLAAVFPVPRCA